MFAAAGGAPAVIRGACSRTSCSPGRRAEAERDVADVPSRAPQAPIPHSLVGVACVLLGDRERADARLDAALESPDVALPYMGIDAWVAPLRGEPTGASGRAEVARGVAQARSTNGRGSAEIGRAHV